MLLDVSLLFQKGVVIIFEREKEFYKTGLIIEESTLQRIVIESNSRCLSRETSSLITRTSGHVSLSLYHNEIYIYIYLNGIALRSFGSSFSAGFMNNEQFINGIYMFFFLQFFFFFSLWYFRRKRLSIDAFTFFFSVILSILSSFDNL